MIAPEDLSVLTRRSDQKGLSRIGQHFVALILLCWLMLVTPGAYALIPGLLYSIFFIFSFCPLHESIHGSLFATRWLNKSTSFILGLMIVLPPRYFHAFHMAHHRYTQLPGKDPELVTPKPENVREYMWIVSGIPYLIAETRVLFRGALGRTDDFVPERQKRGVIAEARLFLVFYLLAFFVSIAMQSMVLVWFWVVPLIVGQPFLRMFLMAEHTGCDEVEDMLRNTRTTYSNRFMTWFCWNMNHHTAHHAYAGVPFFRLHQVTKKLSPEIAVSHRGYLSVNRQIVSQLRKQ